MTNLTVEEFQHIFPDIYERTTAELIIATAKVKRLKADDWMIDIGDPILYIPLVVSGQLRIIREDDNGHELLLYFIRPGETCAMSLTCCSGRSESNVRAVVEEDATLLLLPVQLIDEWTTKYPSFKTFILKTYQRRFEELLNTIDGIAFHNLDDRLLQLLKQRAAAEGSVIKATHQELALSLNSSREVISRLLKQMERAGKIQMGRNRIELK